MKTYKDLKDTSWITKYMRLLRRHEKMRRMAKTQKDYEFLVTHNCVKERCRETLREVGFY